MAVTRRVATLLSILYALGGLSSVIASRSAASSSVNDLNAELPQPSRTQMIEETPTFGLPLPSLSLSEQAQSTTAPALLPTPGPISQVESKMIFSPSAKAAEPSASRSVGDATDSLPVMTPSSSLQSSSAVGSESAVTPSSAVAVGVSTSTPSSRLMSSTEGVSPSPSLSPGAPFCPGEYVDDIKWPASAAGMSVNANCNNGTASRSCSPQGSWGHPDLFDCLTPDFLSLQEKLPSGPASANITTVTLLAGAALNATVNATAKLSPEKLTSKDMKVLLVTLSFIETWSKDQHASSVVEILKTSLMAVDNVLGLTHQLFWRRVSLSLDKDINDLPVQLLRTIEALALRLATVDMEGGQGGMEKSFVREQLAMLYGLYDLSSNQTLHTPSPDALSNNGFHRLTGVTHQSQAVIPPQFVYDRLHGTNVTRPLTYVYLVVKGVSQHLPCDNSSNLTCPPVSHVVSLQLDVKLACPRKSQVRLEGFHLDDSSDFRATTVSVLDTPRCVFYNYTARSWSTYAVKTRYIRSQRVVTCLTHHLTSFAVVKEQQDYTELQDFVFFVYVGSGVLVVAALFGVVALLCTCCIGCQLCKRAHNLIHLNLAVAMAASGLVLIFGVHPIPPIQLVYYIFDVYPSTVCLISSAVVHFCVTSSFVWLMCEAILLVAMVTKLNSSCIGCGCFLFLFGWVLPVAPVVVAVILLKPLTALSSNGQLVCWPTSDWTTELVFWVPIAVFSIVSALLATAAAIGLCSQRKGLTMTEGNDMLKKKFSQLRIMTVGVYVILPCMLGTWVLADLMFRYSSTIVVAALFLVVTPVQAFVLVVVFICRNNFCKRRDTSQPQLSVCCQRTTNGQNSLWAEEGERPTPKLKEAVKESNGAGGSVAESAELKRNPSGVSTTSVTFCKRPVYIATPASNHETGSNSGDSITGADVEMVTYTPLASVDAQSGRSNANGRAELLAISPRKAENFTNVDVADGLPRTDRSGTETSV